MKRTPSPSTREIAKKLGLQPSSVRSRKARGMSLDAPRQLRLTATQRAKIRRAKGTIVEIARRFGCSPTTVKRLRSKPKPS